MRIGVDLPSTVDQWAIHFRNDWGFEAFNPAKPTNTEVGTAARIRVYRQRVESCQPIFVHGDRLGNRPPKAYSAPCSGYGFQVDGDHRRGKLYDDHYRYRYLRWYQLSRAAGRHITFIGFRPDEEFDRSAAAWAMLNQFHRVSIVNVYGTLEPDIQQQVDPVGPLNDRVIRAVASEASIVVIAWGDEQVELFDAEVVERSARLTKAIRRQLQRQLYAFGTDRGQPVGIRPGLSLAIAPKVEGEDSLDDDDDE